MATFAVKRYLVITPRSFDHVWFLSSRVRMCTIRHTIQFKVLVLTIKYKQKVILVKAANAYIHISFKQEKLYEATELQHSEGVYRQLCV